MISTILDTSFAIFSGNDDGKDLPTSFRLHRYIARANSGKSSWPDFVVSERVQIFIKSAPASFDRKSRSLHFSPSKACPSPTADLNNCSNLAWSVAVKNDSRILGILVPVEVDGGADAGAGEEENDWAICDDVWPVF